MIFFEYFIALRASKILILTLIYDEIFLPESFLNIDVLTKELSEGVSYFYGCIIKMQSFLWWELLETWIWINAIISMIWVIGNLNLNQKFSWKKWEEIVLALLITFFVWSFYRAAKLQENVGGNIQTGLNQEDDGLSKVCLSLLHSSVPYKRCATVIPL